MAIYSDHFCTLSRTGFGAKLVFGDGKNNELNLSGTSSFLAAIKAVRRFSVNNEISLLTIEGKGQRNFCSGVDLRELNNTLENVIAGKYAKSVLVDHITQWSELFSELHSLARSLPVAVFVKGRVIGAGLTIASIASVSFACESNVFVSSNGDSIKSTLSLGMPEKRIGLTYPCISIPYLIEKIGIESMLEYLSTNYLEFASESPNSFRIASIWGYEAVDAGFIDFIVDDQIQLFKIQSLLTETSRVFNREHIRQLVADKHSDIKLYSNKKSTDTVLGNQLQSANDLATEVKNLPKIGDPQIITKTAAVFAQQLCQDPIALQTLVRRLG